MPAPDLESRTSALFSACDDLLGDTVTITPPGDEMESITLKVHAAHKDARIDFGISSATAQDAVIDIDASKVPGRPGKGWRVTLPRIAGKTFEPRDTERDESGLRWIFGLKEVHDG